MKILRKLYLAGKRSLEPTLRRARVRNLPPVATIAAVIVVGLAVPLSMAVSSRPTELGSELAAKRLRSWVEANLDKLPEQGPEGTTRCRLPAFHWPADARAARYAFRLYTFDGQLWTGTDRLTAPFFALPSPGDLEPGRYRFTAEGFDAAGKSTGTREGRFELVDAGSELREQRTATRRGMAPAEAMLIEAGYFARKGWNHDALSALLGYLSLAKAREETRESLLKLWQAGDRPKWATELRRFLTEPALY